MKLILFFVLPLFLILFLLIFWAKSRAVSEQEFPEEAVLRDESIQAPPMDSHSLKIVTWNMGYASGDLNNVKKIPSRQFLQNNLDGMVKALKELDADLIFLQEVDFRANRTFFENQLAYLQKKLGLPYAAYRVLWNKRYIPFPYWPPSQHFGSTISGQAVLSRLPIEKQIVKVFPKPPHAFWYNWFYLDRVQQKLILDWQGEKLNIWNVHHEAFHSVTRGQQAYDLGQSLKQEEGLYKIVAGDFNDPTTQPEHQFVHSDFTDTLAYFIKESGLVADNLSFPDDLKTFPSFEPRDKLDHILISKALTFKRRKVVCSTASDHCLVFVEVAKD